MTREEKYRQVRREAGATGVLLALIILFWCAAGFGLAGVPVFVFGLPLWAVMGTVGVWLFAIVGVYVLVHGWFADMSLDDEEQTRGGDAR
ncbi:YhdT family protein [Selenomonas bovis]|uniref:YhdT family protein n=1 Tax=Selenomonas bovis TaxID=416586 RepID=UPI003AB9778A